MSSGTLTTIALIGAGFVLFALYSMWSGRIRYSRGDRDFDYIERSRNPQSFWLTTIAFLAAGIIALGVAAYFYLRG